MTHLQVLTDALSGEDCNWLFTSCLISKLPNPVQDVPDVILGPIGATVMAGWSQMDMMFLSSWIAVPILVDITDPTGTTMWLQIILGNLTFIAAVVGTLISVGYTFITLGLERMKQLGWRLVTLMLVNLAGAAGIAVLDKLIRDSSIGLLKEVGITATSTIATMSLAGINAAILVLLGIIAIIAVIIQWGIMIARGALIPVLIGAWPLSAAIATMGGGAAKRTFSTISGWLIAFVVYPLPAAIVYAAAFRLKSGYDGLGGIMYGFVLEVIAVFMLPALMRILAPQTAKLGSAYGGKIAMEAAISVAETAVTVGAAVVTAGAVAGALGGAGASAGTGSTPGTPAGPPTPNSSPAASPLGADAGPPGAADPGSTPSPGGASGTDAEPAAPPAEAGTGAAPDAHPAPTGAPDTTPATAGTPAAAPAPASAPAAAAPADAGGSRGASREMSYAAQSAAQAVNANVSRGARQALSDADEIIGGKHE